MPQSNAGMPKSNSAHFISRMPKSNRLQFPICLTWALTVWKSQGMTIKVVMKFVSIENEIELGFTYVGMSRKLACEQTDICPCCSLEKLITL